VINGPPTDPSTLRNREKGRNPQHWWTGEVVVSLLVTFFRFWASSVTSDDMPLDVRIDPFSLSLCSFPKKQARFRWRVEFRTARRCEKEITFSLLTGIQPDSGLNAIVTTMFLVPFFVRLFSLCLLFSFACLIRPLKKRKHYNGRGLRSW
jgi:hypothetical protein